MEGMAGSMKPGEAEAQRTRKTLGDLIERLIAGSQSEGAAPGAPEAVFRRMGEVWQLSFAAKTVYCRDRIGVRYVAQLLGRPGYPVPAQSLHLSGGGHLPGAEEAREIGELAEDAGHGWQLSDGATTEVLADDTAIAECRTLLRELESKAEEARKLHDEGRLERLLGERQQLMAYVGACSGADGRPRRASDLRERARKSVSNAIARAIDRIFAQHEVLARHLRNSIRTGYEAVYDPETPVDWEL